MGIEHENSERTPTLAEYTRRAQKADRLDLRVSTVGKVVRYDASKQLVDVQPLIKDAYVDEEDDRQVESFPVIANCPVQFLGAGGFRLTCPISDGTLVIEGTTQPATMGMLVFTDRSLDRWLSGSGQEVDPEIDHDHALSDAIFIPGLMTFGSPWSSCPTDHMTLGADGGVQIHCHNATIALGDESGNDWVALAGKVQGYLTKLAAAFTAWIVVANDGGAALKTQLSTQGVDAAWGSDVSASQVKAK